MMHRRIAQNLRKQVIDCWPHWPRASLAVRCASLICLIGIVITVKGQDSAPSNPVPRDSIPSNTLSSTPSPANAAIIDGTEPGWRELTEKDFVNVNCDDTTWHWEDGIAKCTGTPIGVFRSVRMYKNFELVFQWKHLTSGGNSGFFVWTPEEALKQLPRNKLPEGGIEIQVLDHGYKTQYESSSGKKADWFTTNGDVFAVGKSKMNPFPPTSPNGQRSFPREARSLGVGQWNHYYVRAINGEVRLFVNGSEVSGGNECNPREGYLCLESEGAPLEFKNIRVRELP